jgi:hypothetical protein
MLGQRPWSALGQWRQPSSTGSWNARDGAGLLNLNGVLFMLGGWNPGIYAEPSNTCNEVWKSTNKGQSWIQLADAPWEARHSAGWLVHDDKLWVIGGDFLSEHYQRDIWSSVDGDTWVQVSSDAEPLSDGRALHQVFSHDGKMWIVGGQTCDEFTPTDESTKTGSPYYSDVWSSEDGATWTLVSDNNDWAPKASIIGNAVKDGYMWLVGGGAYDTESLPRIYSNSVWRSTDGVDWEEVTASADFPVRQYNCVEVCGEDLVVAFGWSGANMDDIWASSDGENWRQIGGAPSVRHAASMTHINNELYVLGGPLDEVITWSMS